MSPLSPNSRCGLQGEGVMFSMFLVGNRHTRQGSGFGCDVLIRDANSDAHRGRASGVPEVVAAGRARAAGRGAWGQWRWALASRGPVGCVPETPGRWFVFVFF